MMEPTRAFVSTPEQHAKLQQLIGVTLSCSTQLLADTDVHIVQSVLHSYIDTEFFVHSQDHRATIQSYLDSIQHLISNQVYIALLSLMDPFLQELDHDGQRHGSSSTKYDYFLASDDAAMGAFAKDYVPHGGEAAFWNHYKVQKDAFIKSLSYENNKYPFFSIIQSSGYGKSRLVQHLQKYNTNTYAAESTKKRTITGDPNVIITNTTRIIYFSFPAPPSSASSRKIYPKPNVLFHDNLHHCNRVSMEQAFKNLFQEALNHPHDQDTFELGNGKFVTQATREQQENMEVVFCLDEVVHLFQYVTSDEVSFYRCFQTAAVQFYMHHRECFFVLIATRAFTMPVIPKTRLDPSFKMFTECKEEHREPMEPFFMHHAMSGLQKNNNEKTILDMKINVCLQPRNLFAMGRPIWQAFLHTLPVDADQEAMPAFVHFALVKLLGNPPAAAVPSPAALTQEQCIALLACRTCLTISPSSVLARGLVSNHMATVLDISQNREEYYVEYPSEPMLAIAARSYMLHYKDVFWQTVIPQLRSCFLSSAVPKGDRGEVTVQLLNLIAVDKAMGSDVRPVKLVDFLSQFDRAGVLVSSLITNDGSVQVTEMQTVETKDLQTPQDPVNNLEDTAREQKGEQKWDGMVCFTHFVYLSCPSDSAPLITPNLLRYAYRRTAAIAIEQGSKGIDWIIPVRVGDDEFVGLYGQDKVSEDDVLEDLVEMLSEEMIRSADFLTPEEIKLFQDKRWSLNWPSIVFSIGVVDQGAALVEYNHHLLRSSSEETENYCPCIVLTGLGYHNLVSEDIDGSLRQCQNVVYDVPEIYEKYVPLFGGCRADKL